MTEMITAPQILEFLCKAQQLNMHPNIKQTELIFGRKGYMIELYYDWAYDNDYYIRATFISNQGTSTWEDCDYEFENMNAYVDMEFDRLKEEEIKKQKRNELIARLTDEEKELLGLK